MDMSLKIDETFLTQTLRELVQIDSRNPSLAPDGPGEAVIGAYLAERLTALGLDVAVHELEPRRVNVVGKLKGTGGGRSLLLNGHLDTVGVEGMTEPFSGVIRSGRLYGRGSGDMKGALASMLAAVKALADAPAHLAGDIIFTAVADEEYLSLGTADLVKHYTADAAIITEPTDLAIACAHRGFIWYDVETFGRAAHGSLYTEGIDANMRMGRFLAELDHLEQTVRQRTPHPLVGPPSLHASVLRGGSEMSTYAAHCLLQIERRTIPGESEAQATGELQAIIDRLTQADPTFKATVRPTVERTAFGIDPGADIVCAVTAATALRLGATPRMVGVPFWTDAALLAQAGIPTVLLGPTGGGFHAAEEWVGVQSVVDLAYILAETASEFCQLSR
jgi:acetylornithine deacetylase